jgi:hypothetical protein
VSGPPAWIVWALAASVAAIPVCLIGALVSALIDRYADVGPIKHTPHSHPRRPAEAATEATHTSSPGIGPVAAEP